MWRLLFGHHRQCLQNVSSTDNVHNIKVFPSHTTKQIPFSLLKYVGGRFVWHGLKPYFQLSKKTVHTGFKRDDICQRVDIVTLQLSKFDVREGFDDRPNGCFLEQSLVVVDTHEREWKDMSSYRGLSSVSWGIEIGAKWSSRLFVSVRHNAAVSISMKSIFFQRRLVPFGGLQINSNVFRRGLDFDISRRVEGNLRCPPARFHYQPAVSISNRVTEQSLSKEPH